MTGRGNSGAIDRQILWLVLGVVFALHFLPRVVTQTMFFDGLIYASIARNLASGWGGLWELRFSETLFASFAEHPPLAMWFQAVFFRFFGDHIIVEKALAIGQLFLAGGLLLALVARLCRARQEARLIAILSLIFALLAGRLAWTFANNMLESPLTIVGLSAVLLGVIACDARRRGARLLLALLAGGGVGCAVLVKGPVGLYPLAVGGIYWLVYRKPSLSGALLVTAVMIAGTALVLLFTLQVEAGREYLTRYLESQVLSSLAGGRGDTGGRLSAVKTLLRMLAYPLLLAALLFALRRLWRWRGWAQRDGRAPARPAQAGWFLLLLGLSASVPILASPRVWSFYFTPSLPFYGAAIAIWVGPVVCGTLSAMTDLVKQRLRAGLVVLAILAAGLPLSRLGAPGEDAGLIGTASAIAAAACPVDATCTAVVSTCPAVWQDWQLHGYLQRHFNISLRQVTTPFEADDIFVHRRSCGVTDLSRSRLIHQGAEGTGLYKREGR